MKQRRERVLVPGLLIAACVVAFAWALHRTHQHATKQVEREDEALAVLRSLEKAQHDHQQKTGKFGWLGELSLSSPVSSDDRGTYFEHAGYRFDALLPGRRQLTPALQVVTQSAGVEDRELRTRHFALVARPVNPGSSGYRTFYVDESGLVWINEGVSDEPTLKRNPLPRAHLTTSEGKDVSGRVWKRLDQLKPRGTDEWERR